MITSAILNMLKSIISALLNTLPSSPTFVTQNLSSFVSRLAPINAIFPIQEIFTFLVYLGSLLAVFLTAWAINRIINLIRGAG